MRTQSKIARLEKRAEKFNPKILPVPIMYDVMMAEAEGKDTIGMVLNSGKDKRPEWERYCILSDSKPENLSAEEKAFIEKMDRILTPN